MPETRPKAVFFHEMDDRRRKMQNFPQNRPLNTCKLQK
jgi:hypothetical protein